MGWNPFEDIATGARDLGHGIGRAADDVTGGKFTRDPIGTLINAGTNYMTMGLAGYDSRSKKFGWKEGIASRGASEILGEITGTNAGRDDRWEARMAVDAENAQAAQDLLNKRSQDEGMDRAASGAARGIRNSATARSRGNLNWSLGSDETDFLGV